MSADAWGFLAAQVVAAIVALAGAIAAWLKVRTQIEQVKTTTVEAVKVAEANNAKLGEVKKLVDGQHTALLDELRAVKAALKLEQAKPKQVDPGSSGG